MSCVLLFCKSFFDVSLTGFVKKIIWHDCDKIHQHRIYHVRYHLIKYQVFWQHERSDFFIQYKKFFRSCILSTMSLHVIIACLPSLYASLSTVLILLQIKYFFSKGLTLIE